MLRCRRLALGMRVLHVVECYEAGVGHAVSSYIENTPGTEHHLLYSGSLNPDRLANLRSSRPFSRRGIGRVADVVAAVRDLGPDVVHAHSSWAGVYTRIRALSAPVVYQPHGFAFETKGFHPLRRFAYRAVEAALAARVVALASLSDREETLMRQISPRSEIRRITNVAACDDSYAATWQPSRVKRVAMVGRLGAQKAPGFYSEVVREALSMDPDIEFVWIGDGDPRMRELLESRSVRVTGWLAPDEVAASLARCSIYFHSADYEGFPLSVLDAAKVGLPIVVRSLPAFRGTGLIEVRSKSEAASLIVQMINDEDRLRRCSQASSQLTSSMSPTAQAASLECLYAEALK